MGKLADPLKAWAVCTNGHFFVGNICPTKRAAQELCKFLEQRKPHKEYRVCRIQIGEIEERSQPSFPTFEVHA